ncbi:MAG: hypothetical protein JWO17_2522 [Actinomycetia bacterium]|jgi:hypothetical protein|nr:hypothetical protein [Actinomycetes bacterium]
MRNATNESVHRTMNEQRERDAGDPDTQMKCECECFRVECGNSFQITIDAYETVRASGRTFVVAPGHQTVDEPILSTTPAYLVIAKLGEQGNIAELLNPRH